MAHITTPWYNIAPNAISYDNQDTFGKAEYNKIKQTVKGEGHLIQENGDFKEDSNMIFFYLYCSSEGS